MRNRIIAVAAIAASLSLQACVFQPLYGNSPDNTAGVAAVLSSVSVSQVDTRVGQQVRNHLLFLFQGGRGAAEPRYELRIRAADSNRQIAASQVARTTTAGTVSITVSYDLIELGTNTRIDGGSRVGNAAYDRTGQSFANLRAIRDAENRAATDVAEQIRLAVAARLSQ
ncbi:MAG: LPS assembly lipoprotein LptE [Nitratireductor sp.]